MTSEITIRTNSHSGRKTFTVNSEYVAEFENFCWCVAKISGKLYPTTSEKIDGGIRRLLYAHQLFARLEGLAIPETYVMDHINADTFNNTRENLRAIPRVINSMLHQKKPEQTSRYRGVYFNRDCQKYLCYIRINGQRKYLGCFQNENEAGHAYNDAIFNRLQELGLSEYFEIARNNF